MKFSIRVLKSAFFCAFLFSLTNALCQQLSDEVSSKLSESDQKKITKSDNLVMKGDLQLSKIGYPGDKQLLDMLSMGETKELKKFAGERMVAAGNYKDANTGKFEVYEKNIKDFWNKYTGDKFPLKIVKDAEDKAIQQFKDAQQLRKTVEKNKNTSERINQLIEVETSEKSSLTTLQKVLYVYQKYPANYDPSWFSNIEEQNQPVTTKTVKEGNVTYNEVTPVVTQPVIETPQPEIIKKDTVKDSSVKKPIKSTEQVTPGDSSLYMLVEVNEDQIDQFNSFLQRTYPKTYENYIIDFQNIDISNLQSLRNAWYQYRYGVVSADSLVYMADNQAYPDSSAQKGTVEQIITQDITTDTAKIVHTQPEKTDVAVNKTQQNKVTKKPKTVQQKVKTDQVAVVTDTQVEAPVEHYETPTKTTPKVIKHTSEPIATGFLFKVQIAASRVPLSESILQNMYQGNEKVTETFEDNWYKYTIGEFNTYKQARYLRDETSVPGVFVVAYLNGKRIKITPSVVTKRQVSEEMNTEGIEPGRIEFRIQLGASKIPLDNSTLKNIYSGPKTIDTIEEDGWIKYSLLAGNKLSDALELLKTVNVPGAFIVAYYNNQKLNLRTAIKLTKNN